MQDTVTGVSSPPGFKLIRAKLSIPREVLSPSGQDARGYLRPFRTSSTGGKINWYTVINSIICIFTEQSVIKHKQYMQQYTNVLFTTCTYRPIIFMHALIVYYIFDVNANCFV